MQKFTDVEYDHKPNEVEIYKTGVDEIVSCVEKEKEDPQTGEKRTVWICDVNRYTLLEYVYLQQSKYNSIQSELTQAQVALIEVYEMLIGGGV